MEETERRVEVASANDAKMMPGGVAVAALMAGMLGMLALAVVNVFTAASKPFNVSLVGLGVATSLIWPPVFEYLAGH